MEAFRQRKGTPVPWDIERQNERSRRRNTSAIQRRRRERSDGDTQVPNSVRSVISSSGQSLEASVQRAMEDRMGESFDDVRVHTGPTAAQACESINARAFTVGNHVAFNRGEYDPESADGQHVIAHELAHVRQQTGGAVSMLPQESADLESDPDPRLENDTEETAQQVVNGGQIGLQRLQDTTAHLQRLPSQEATQQNELDRIYDAVSETFDIEISDLKNKLVTLDNDEQKQVLQTALRLDRGGDLLEISTVALEAIGRQNLSGFVTRLYTHVESHGEINADTIGAIGSVLVDPKNTGFDPTTHGDQFLYLVRHGPDMQTQDEDDIAEVLAERKVKQRLEDDENDIEVVSQAKWYLSDCGEGYDDLERDHTLIHDESIIGQAATKNSTVENEARTAERQLSTSERESRKNNVNLKK